MGEVPTGPALSRAESGRELGLQAEVWVQALVLLAVTLGSLRRQRVPGSKAEVTLQRGDA